MIPNINLLPKNDKRKTDSNLGYSIIGVIAILVLAFMMWQYFSARSSLPTLTRQEIALQQEVAKLQTEHDKLLALQNRGSLEDSVTFAELVSYPVSPLIDETQNLLPKNTYVRNYSFSKSTVKISVDFETLSSIADYVRSLENSQYFSVAQLSSVANEFDSQTSSDQEQKNESEKFNEIPRYSANITLRFNQTYLANGGDTNE